MLSLSDGLRDCEDPECCENKDCQSNQVESTKYTQTHEGTYNCARHYFHQNMLFMIRQISSTYQNNMFNAYQNIIEDFTIVLHTVPSTATITIITIIMMRHCSCATPFPARSPSCFNGSPPPPPHPSSKRF